MDLDDDVLLRSTKPTDWSGIGEVSRGVTQERSRRRRERILDAAFHVFSRLGYGRAAVDEIAREAETSKVAKRSR